MTTILSHSPEIDFSVGGFYGFYKGLYLFGPEKWEYYDTLGNLFRRLHNAGFKLREVYYYDNYLYSGNY